MTHGKIIAAHRAIARLADKPMPLKTAWALHKMRQAMREVVDFRIERERALIEELKPKEDGGRLIFASTEQAAQWQAEIAKLDALEAEWNIATVALPDDVVISVADIEALDGFVTIEGA